MKRMFIVGSDAFLVNSMRFALRYASGVNVFGVLDGDASVRQAVRESEADLVLLDGRGFPERAAERLREVRDEREEALIVVLVGDLQSELIQAALEAGALVCLSSAAVLPQLQALLADPAAGGQGQVALMANGNGNGNGHHAAAVRVEEEIVDEPEPEACPLTARELEILRAVAEGHTNARIGRDLWVTEQTVKFHLSNIYRKLGVANRTEASRYALLNDLFAARRPVRRAPIYGAPNGNGHSNGHSGGLRALDPARR
jgi:DNA-binding NarL/FixJ family response regulator